MKRGTRKLALTLHVTLSVGWLGAVLAYLALAIVGLAGDAQMVRAAYVSMNVVAWSVIVPLSLVTLLVGIVESLGTEWGLLRHWWVAVKFFLTTLSTALLLQHAKVVTRMSAVARGQTLSSADFRALRIQLVVHAAGAAVVLLAATVLSVYKPWGLTPYGLRKQRERRGMDDRSRLEFDAAATFAPTTETPRWVYVVGLHALGLALLFLFVHLAGGGAHIH